MINTEHLLNILHLNDEINKSKINREIDTFHLTVARNELVILIDDIIK